MVPEPEEDLLRDLLRERLVAEEPAGEAVDRATVAAIGLGEGVLPVARDRDDERGIADVAQRLGVHWRHTYQAVRLDHPTRSNLVTTST